MTDEPCVLLVEDEESDVILMRRAFQTAGLTCPLEIVRDGLEAMQFLERERPETDDRLPALVLLDMKLPRRSGFDVLRWIRGQDELRSLPVAILTSSSRPDDIERAYALGANGFWVKPTTLDQRIELASFVMQWLRINHPPLVSTDGVRAAARRRAR